MNRCMRMPRRRSKELTPQCMEMALQGKAPVCTLGSSASSTPILEEKRDMPSTKHCCVDIVPLTVSMDDDTIDDNHLTTDSNVKQYRATSGQVQKHEKALVTSDTAPLPTVLEIPRAEHRKGGILPTARRPRHKPPVTDSNKPEVENDTAKKPVQRIKITGENDRVPSVMEKELPASSDIEASSPLKQNAAAELGQLPLHVIEDNLSGTVEVQDTSCEESTTVVQENCLSHCSMPPVSVNSNTSRMLPEIPDEVALSSSISSKLSPLVVKEPTSGITSVTPIRAVADSTQGLNIRNSALVENGRRSKHVSQRTNMGLSEKQEMFHSQDKKSAVKRPVSRVPAMPIKSFPHQTSINTEPSHTVKRRCSTGVKRRASTSIMKEWDHADDDTAEDGNSRLLMRDWLQREADRGEMNGIEWLDKANGIIKIAWKHGSKSGWSEQDSLVFTSWAKYTGRFDPTKKDQFKRWKANFRCALHSLPDVCEIKEKNVTRNGDQYRVYQLLPPALRRRSKGSGEMTPRRRSRSSSVPYVETSPPKHIEDETAAAVLVASRCGVSTAPAVAVPAVLTSFPQNEVLSDGWQEQYLSFPPFVISMPVSQEVIHSQDHSYAGNTGETNVITQPVFAQCNTQIPTVVENLSDLSSDDETEDKPCVVNSTGIQSSESFHEMTPVTMSESSYNAVYVMGVDGIYDHESPTRSTSSGEVVDFDLRQLY